MGTIAVDKDAKSARSRRPKRYDKDLVRDQTLELLTVRLGPAKEQGARVVWDCPACGKREKYSVVKASGKGGCLVAGCRLAGSADVFVMLAGLEDLDYKADFLVVLARSYELLGLEPVERGRDVRGDSQRAPNRGANGTPPDAGARDKDPARQRTGNGGAGQQAGPKTLPIGRPRTSAGPSDGGLRPAAAEAAGTADLDAHLGLAAWAYERILEICPLETRDRRYLKTRGLSSATIRRGRFGTMTAPRASQVKAQLQRELGRKALLCVPGFSEEEETGRIKFTLTGNYVLIPYHDAGGRITTIEGRIVGEPTDGRKYVTLRRAGNHLYLFPGHQPGDLVAVCEGAMGAIVAAECGISVGAIMGCERFRASPSPEMLDGAPGDPLLELKGADFAGRPLPYIPDADDPPNPNVLRAAPKAARWIAEPQNAEAAVCLLPKGADLDAWLLSLDPKERADRFAELLASANPPEDDQPLPRPSASSVGAGEDKEKTDAAVPRPEDTSGPASAPAAEGATMSPAEPPPQALDHKRAAAKGDGPSPDRGRILTEKDLHRNNGGAKPSKAKTPEKSSHKGSATETSGEGSQPGLWDEPDPDDGPPDGSPQTAQREVSRGARKLRDEVYRALIDKLPPKEEHLLALEKSGVMRATARVGRFASLDAGAATKAVSDLAERFGAKRLLTVPGFEADEGGKVRLCPATGGAEEYVLIPCFDADGLLTGMEGLPFDRKGGELDTEETVPLMGAGSHLYVFAHYAPGEVEGFCEGPLGALLAAQNDVVIGAIGGFRRYRAATGPGEGRQHPDAALPELEGVDFAGRQIPYVPRAGAPLGEANARYHEAPKAARRLVETHGGTPAVVDLAGEAELALDADDASPPAGRPTGPASLGDWLLTHREEGAHERLREIFSESPARRRAIHEGEDAEEADIHHDAGASSGEQSGAAAPPLPTKVLCGFVALAALIGAVLAMVLIRLQEFGGYVSDTPEGDPILYAGPLGQLRRLADSSPFHLLYEHAYLVAFAAAVGLALFFLARFRAAHVARWRAGQTRLQERWELHLAPATTAPPDGVLTVGELSWGLVSWPVAYLISGWLLSAGESVLSVAATLGMIPGRGRLAADPALASVYAATLLAVFVLWRRRSIRSAEARMLAGKIRH